jgi:hypothetical protein
MVFSENNVCPPGKSADPLSLQQAQEERRANSKTGRNPSIATCFNAFLSRGDKIFCWEIHP